LFVPAVNVLTEEVAVRPKKALVIEDHAAVARLLMHVFARAGIGTKVVGNGAEAIVRLRNGAGDYALVCSDVELPGASGWTVLEWVHTCHPALPMMLISGVNDGDFLLEANRRGAVAAFRKPFNLSEIEQTLAELFPYL
jgi:DNA-binding NtrC family response regulator